MPLILFRKKRDRKCFELIAIRKHILGNNLDLVYVSCYCFAKERVIFRPHLSQIDQLCVDTMKAHTCTHTVLHRNDILTAAFTSRLSFAGREKRKIKKQGKNNRGNIRK